MSERIQVSDIIPTRPETLYAAWLDPAEHGRMTGGTVTDEGDGRFTAWDGYISGRTVVTVPHSKIVQTWRTTEFPEDAPDSDLTITFEPEGDGTRLTLTHDNLPSGQGDSYESGWKEHYLTPIKSWFGSATEKLHEASDRLGEVRDAAMEAVERAQTSARKQTQKTVKAVKRAGRSARAKLKAVGNRVKALVSRKKQPSKAKVPLKKATRPKAAGKKPAPKKAAASRKSSPAGKKTKRSRA
jgi:uncharacterized protein YndB with AHSA1/START domain